MGRTCGVCSGYGTRTPTLLLASRYTWLGEGKVFVQVSYRNEESVSTRGRVTVEVEAQTKTYTATSSDTTFPPNEETQVAFAVEGISSTDYNYLQERKVFSTRVTLQVNDIVCPSCDGTGLGSLTLECILCGGTGFVNCPTCGGSGVARREQDGIFDSGGAVYGVTAAAVIAGVAVGSFVVVRKRTVKEEDLRRLLPSEFNDWVLKRLAGKSSSQSDDRMGINGYTMDNTPVGIKQVDSADRNAIENFAVAMGRRNAKKGIIVAFSFGNDAIRGRVQAKLKYGLEIQMVTVKELIESGNRTL
jgi:hypothetical protein